VVCGEVLERQVHLLFIWRDARKCLREITIFSGGPDSVLRFNTLVEVYRLCIRRIYEKVIKETYGASRKVDQDSQLQNRIFGDMYA
jgi:hypothetical protein